MIEATLSNREMIFNEVTMKKNTSLYNKLIKFDNLKQRLRDLLDRHKNVHSIKKSFQHDFRINSRFDFHDFKFDVEFARLLSHNHVNFDENHIVEYYVQFIELRLIETLNQLSFDEKRSFDVFDDELIFDFVIVIVNDEWLFWLDEKLCIFAVS